VLGVVGVLLRIEAAAVGVGDPDLRIGQADAGVGVEQGDEPLEQGRVATVVGAGEDDVLAAGQVRPVVPPLVDRPAVLFKEYGTDPRVGRVLEDDLPAVVVDASSVTITSKSVNVWFRRLWSRSSM